MQKTYSQGLASTTRNMIAVFATLLMAFIFMLSPTVVYAQVAPDPFSCYGIADEYNGDGNTDGLAIINRLTGDANLIGTGTGTAGIEAMAFVPQDVNGTVQQVLFAVADPNNPNTTSSNTLGTVDLTTGIWTPIDAAVQIGTGTDANGTTFDFSTSGDIDGLTYDVQRNILWATQRNAGDGNPDYLLQLDPATGQIVPDAFGPGIDWVAVPLATDPAFQTDAGLPYDDVDDLAVDPITGRIYIINNKGGTGGGLVELDPITGLPLNYIGLFTGTTSVDGIVDDMEGLAFFNDGQLYGSTGNNGPDPADLNQLFTIDIATGAAALAGAFPDETRDIEALGCLTAPAFITLEKATNGEDADQPTGPAITVGEPVTWTYVIENTGSVDLLDMTLNDDIEGDISNRCVEGALPNPFAPGATFTCTVVGVASVTGQYANIGTVNATYQAPVEGGTEDIPLAATDPSHYFGEFNPLPGIEIVKTAGDAVDGETYNAGAPGVVTFTYVVTNTGNTHLTNITINDDAGTPDDTSDDVITDSTTCAGLAGPLAPDGTVTCTADIQVDGDATNIATTTGTPTDENGTPYPDVEPPTDNDDAVVVVTPLVPGISIVKTAGDAADGGTLTITEAGLVTFTYVVENTGDTHLSDITIVDDAGTPADAGDDVTVDSTTCAELAGPLAPGGTVTCTAAIQVNGDATNVAVTTGNPTDENGVDIPDATNPTADDPAIVVLAVPGISIVKTAGDAADGDTFTITEAGLVTFIYVVENTGGTYLSNITIVDDAGTSADASDDVTVDSTTCAELAGPLAPGGIVTCTAAIQVNGDATNVAVTTGNPTDENGVDIPDATDPVDDDPAVVEYTPGVPGISIVKTAGNAVDGAVYEINEPGPVTFTYFVENTGTTYLIDITIADDAGTPADASDDVLLTSAECAGLAGPLAPGGNVTCTADIQVDGDAINVATTTGTPSNEAGDPLPDVEPPTAEDDAEVILLGTIGDTVWFDVNGDGIQSADENGIPGVTLTLTQPDGSTVTTVTDGDGLYLFTELPAGDYFVTVDAGSLPPNAIAQTYDADGLTTPNESSLTLGSGEDNLLQDFGYQPAGPGISIIKTAGDAADGDILLINSPGDVTYQYVVTNIGNTYLTDITITDDAGTPGDISDDVLITGAECAGLAGPLEPQGFVICTTDIAVDGTVTNNAGTTGTPSDENGNPLPDVDPPTDEDDAVVEFIAGPGISITKTAGDAIDGDDYVVNAPEEVLFTFLVENTGNTHLTEITITDDAGTAGDTSDDVTITSSTCPELAGPLAPSGTVVCTLVLAINSDTTNNAGTTGTPTDENGVPLLNVDPPTDEDDAVVLLQAGPGIQLLKTVFEGHSAGAGCPGGELVEAASGSPVTYCFEVKNTGTTYLNNIEVNDPDLGITRTDMTLLSGTEPLAQDQSLIFYYETTLDTSLLNTADTTGIPSDENGVPIPDLTPPTDDDTAEVIPFSMLGDRVWFDINANGVQDPDEEGIAGVTVTLYDESNNVIETQVTDENGNYGFFVAPGAYSISFDADDLEGYYLSPLDAIADDSTDSDADPGNDGRTEPTSLIVGESDMSWDAGVFAPPNLQIAKDDGGAIIQPNGTVIYSIVYSNTGVSDATGVIITERVPEYTTFSPELSTPGWDCEQLPGAASETCSFEIGRVAKGSTGRLTLTFVVFVDRFIPEDVFAINNVVTITDDESKGAIPDGQFTDELITPIFRPTDLNLIPEPGFTGNARVEIYLPTIMVR